MTLSKYEIEQHWKGLQEDIDLEVATAPIDRLPALSDLIDKINDLYNKYRMPH